MSWAASYQEQLNAEKAAGAGDAGQKTGENNNNGSPFRGFGSGASSAFGAPAAGGGFGAATNGNNSGFGAATKSGGGFGAQPASGGFGGFGATASSTSGRGAVGFGHQNRSGFGVSAQPAEQQQQTGIPARNTTTTPYAPTASVTSSFGLQQPRVDWSGQPTASPSQQMQAAPAAKPTFGRQVAPQPAQNPVQFVAQHAPAVPVSSVLHHRRSPIEEAGEKPMNPEDVALLNKFLHRTVKMMTDHVVDVSRQQADPRSPLHSVLQFKELRLKDTLLKALDIMGYHQPSKIQEFALPLLLMEPPTNMIAQSQSGTGKTAAFVLTMLSRVVPENHWPQCVCLAPTYELAMQIGEVVNRMAKFMPNVKVHYAVKGTARLPHGFQLQEQIIIGTPGRMIDYLTKMRCFNPAKIVCLVLDEADVMISQQGHLDLSHRIYNTIENASPGVQTMLFSATYDQAVMEFAEKLIKDAVSVTLKREDLALSNIKQFFVECRDRDSKYQAVCDLYSGLIIASSVIFTRTRSAATWLAQKLKTKGHEVALLHGDMTVQERAAAIEAFKNGIYKVLITTNVCSRGIDVSQVTIVINYDLPYYVDRPDEPDNETYLHRIGRTGRFGKAGIAINFVDSIEDLYLVRKLESHFGKPIPKLDPSNLDELEAIEKEF